MQGVAVKEAAKEMRRRCGDQLLAMAAEMQRCEIEELEMHNGEVFHIGTETPLVPIRQVAAEMHRLGKRTSSSGWQDNFTKDVESRDFAGGHLRHLWLVYSAS